MKNRFEGGVFLPLLLMGNVVGAFSMRMYGGTTELAVSTITPMLALFITRFINGYNTVNNKIAFSMLLGASMIMTANEVQKALDVQNFIVGLAAGAAVGLLGVAGGYLADMKDRMSRE